MWESEKIYLEWLDSAGVGLVLISVFLCSIGGSFPRVRVNFPHSGVTASCVTSPYELAWSLLAASVFDVAVMISLLFWSCGLSVGRCLKVSFR